MMKANLALTLVTSLFATAAAIAQTSPNSSTEPSPERTARSQLKFDRHFAKTDKNRDGYIDREEAISSKHLVQNFDAIDSNKDGQISKEEMQFHQAPPPAKHH